MDKDLNRRANIAAYLDRQEFWKNVYLSCIANGESCEIAASKAFKATQQFDEYFVSPAI